MTWKRIKNACRVVLLRQGNLELLLHRYKAIYNVGVTDAGFSIARNVPHTRDIVLFPAIDWGFRFQRPQHLAFQLAALGYRIFYIATVPLLIPGRGDYLIQGTPSPNLVLVQLSSGCCRIPDLYKDNLTVEEVSGFLRSYESLCKDFCIEAPTVLIQQPFWWPLVCELNVTRILYDCLDHHAGFHDQPNPVLLGHEQELVDKACAVVVTSDTLRNWFPRTRECHVIRNGCEFDRFSQTTRAGSPSRPVIGYVGAVSEWFDGQLLSEIARARPDWQFDIYGATVGANISIARSLPNVNFFGEIPYEHVPNAIAQFDVCLIPFKVIPLTLATNPVKVYEYLACGRPVVATELPELVGMQSLDVFCANTAKQFIAQIECALEVADQPDRVKTRKDWASQNDWSIRANQLITLLSAE